MSRLAVLLLLCATPAVAADFTVDLGKPLKPVDHAASGALYGIAGPGWPPQGFIDAIHPRNFTQMAPGGGQLPNGEPKPVGDALVVAPMAEAAGATVTVRMPDTFPDFPYIWTGDDKWTAAVAQIVSATVAAKPANIYAYEIWNEPDWTWQSQWGAFDPLWARTYGQIRALDAGRRIMGPSLSKWDEAWMRRFLAAAIASRTVPDIVSWHELDPSTSTEIDAHVAAYRALEAGLGLAPRPISIDEYGAQRDMADPGALLRYIAAFERTGVDTADLAFWHRPGRLSDLLVSKQAGTGPATEPLPTGGYWLYAWYGGMAGQMVEARPDGQSALVGIAAYDAEARQAVILVGGAPGSASVHVAGLGKLGPIVHVAAEVTHWTGTDGAEAAPQPLFSADYRSAGDALTIPLDIGAASDAVHVVLSPSPLKQLAARSAVTMAANPRTERIEAETGQMAGGRKFTILMAPGNFSANRASGDAYVGLFNRAGATLRLPISAPAGGTYRLTFGYSNGQAVPVRAALRVDGRAPLALSFPPTQGRELFGELAVTESLPAGPSTLSLSLAAPIAGMPVGPSVLEIDRLDITPLPHG